MPPEKADRPEDMEGHMPSSSSMAETKLELPRTAPLQPPAPSPERRRLSMVKEGDTLSGRYQYRLSTKLGQGGFGSVFLGDRIPNGTRGEEEVPSQVAIKCFVAPEGLDVEMLFKRELSALLPLRHGHIPRVFDWGIEGSVTFVVLEYFCSGSLNKKIADGVQLTVDEAWRLLQDLLEVLNVAHRANILHLDIKPANVLIGDDGRFLLTDFGISQGNLVSSSVVLPGTGTPGYRAPEQEIFQEELIGCQTDLWGVGATVWSAFTGMELSDSRLLDMVRIYDGKSGLASISSMRSDCPQDLEEIVMSLLANDPNDRPGSAAEVASWVRESREGVAVPMAIDVVFQRRLPDDFEIASIVQGLIDPLWSKIFSSGRYHDKIVAFTDGDYLCLQNETSFHAFILLSGKVVIEYNKKAVGEETREGTFLGEVSTLTGLRRTASMRAEGPVWVCVLNAAELERMVMADPAIGIRLIKSLAERVANDRIRD
jgi:serine/threonine protein kinase